jgi:molecular chaperone HscA
MALFQIFDPSARPTPIGIDLGTTHSLVAYTVDGRPECVLDCDMSPLLPSVVHYLEHGGVMVGNAGKEKAALHPRETLVSVKRFMGRGADDAETRRMGPYDFAMPEAGQSNTVRFKVHGRTLTPVEVSAEILRVLRTNAEEKLRTIGGAVITVPAYFDEAQRQATKDAAKLAGLEVLRLLNEPTAAALAYGLDKGRTRGTFAVYDLGGGTFDVTILSLDDGVFQVRSTGGDAQLGGDDMDRAFAEWVFRHMGVDPATASPQLVRAALDAARVAKHELTDRPTTVIAVTAGGTTFERSVRRTEFEGHRAAGDRAHDARREARPARRGAATRGGRRGHPGGRQHARPAVREHVKKLFGQEPLSDIDPDQVVAFGAAIQANLLAGDGAQDDALILDVIPLSLGIETMGGVAEKILPRNTTIPAGRAQQFTTYADGQTGFELHVVQGERELAADNRSLAKFTLKGIPPMPAGAAKLEVTFRVDADGMLTVTARELNTGIEQHIEVTPSFGLSGDDVERMLLESYEHAESDLAARQLRERIIEGERVIAATEAALKVDGDLLDEDERAELDGALKALRDAIAAQDGKKIHHRTDGLDRATQPLAERRMDRAVQQAMKGRAVAEIEDTVKDRPGAPAPRGLVCGGRSVRQGDLADGDGALSQHGRRRGGGRGAARYVAARSGAEGPRPGGISLRRGVRLLDVPRAREEGPQPALGDGGRGERHPRQGLRRRGGLPPGLPGEDRARGPGRARHHPGELRDLVQRAPQGAARPRRAHQADGLASHEALSLRDRSCAGSSSRSSR